MSRSTRHVLLVQSVMILAAVVGALAWTAWASRPLEQSAPTDTNDPPDPGPVDTPPSPEEHTLSAKQNAPRERGDITVQSVPPPLPEATPPTQPSTSRPIGARRAARCGNGLKLVASVFHPRHPERSLVALRKDGGKMRMLRNGQRSDTLTVLDVTPTATLLRIGASEPCFLPVFLPASERAHERAQPAAAPRKPAGKAKGRVTATELREQIRVVGLNQYAIQRELLTRILGNPLGFARATRVRSVQSHGHASGMELVRLGKEAPLALLGLQQGDVLRSLNGQSLATADGLFAALPMLRQLDRLTFSVLRANVPVSISIKVE